MMNCYCSRVQVYSNTDYRPSTIDHQPTSLPAGNHLFNPDAHIQHMSEGIFPHDLFKREMVIADFPEFGLRLNQDSCFVDIIHCSTNPALFIIGQRKIILLTLWAQFARLIHRCPDPDIVEIIGIRMPDDKENIVQGTRVLNLKTDFRLEAALPFLAGQGNVFFKYAGGNGTGQESNTGQDIDEKVISQDNLFTKIISAKLILFFD